MSAFRTERDLRDLFDVLSRCALIYAPFCLVELRLSPQFHNWVYGYGPSQFQQAVRGGGYRPVVFMNHGLSVAMFMFSCLCAGMGLQRVRAALRPTPGTRIAVAGILVFLCRSLGAITYSLAAAVMQFLLSSKALGRVVLALALLAIAYPATRASKVFPTSEVVAFFDHISPERADSLEFRFANEDALVARAMKRPIFGWGTFSRNRVFASWGQDMAVTDGYWILQLGSFGYVGLAGFLALMVVPLLRFLRNRARMPEMSQVLLGALALIVVVFTIDLLPNARSDFLSIAYAGCLFGLARRRRPIATRPPSREAEAVHREPVAVT
jgi:hypothetical protein